MLIFSKEWEPRAVKESLNRKAISFVTGKSLPIYPLTGVGSPTFELASFVLDFLKNSSANDMSTISSIYNASLGYVAPMAVDTPATSASSFSQTFAVAQTPQSWLTTAEASQASRPNVKEFMDRTDAVFLDASELLYGVVGSNTDVRDWAAIMASDDPITAARQATGQMYGRTDTPVRTDATYMGASDTMAKEGNFAVRLLKDEDDHVVDQGLKLIDAQGLLLRDAGSSPESIARNAWLFGFDTQPLAKLVPTAVAVSADLGIAVQQASTIAHTHTAVSQMPVFAMAADNVSLIGLTDIDVPSPSKTEPVVIAQIDDQATSPSLEQMIEEATTNTLAYVDTSTYLSSLFRT